MRLLSRVQFATLCLTLGEAAAAGAGQSSPKPSANDDCLAW